MCVEISLSIAPDEFQFGSILATDADVRIQLARVVPGYQDPFTLFWAHGPERERFETAVRAHDSVDSLRPICETAQSAQYALRWHHETDEFATVVAETGAVVLEGGGDGTGWTFALRFGDRERLLDFHDQCRERGIDFDVETLESGAECTHPATKLTEDQREAVLLALKKGYFAIPKQTTLTELGEELDISQQAVSQRLNRAVRNCLYDYFHLPPK